MRVEADLSSFGDAGGTLAKRLLENQMGRIQSSIIALLYSQTIFTTYSTMALSHVSELICFLNNDCVHKTTPGNEGSPSPPARSNFSDETLGDKSQRICSLQSVSQLFIGDSVHRAALYIPLPVIRCRTTPAGKALSPPKTRKGWKFYVLIEDPSPDVYPLVGPCGARRLFTTQGCRRS